MAKIIKTFGIDIIIISLEEDTHSCKDCIYFEKCEVWKNLSTILKSLIKNINGDFILKDCLMYKVNE